MQVYAGTHTPIDKREAALQAAVGLWIPQVYLPHSGIDLKRWAVVACDQYTSQPEYWKRVEKLVGDAPSTLNLILPEVYLGKNCEAERVQRAQAKMREYLAEGVLELHEGLIYVERTVDGKTRKGLIASLDLEHYDFRPGSQSLVRATEGTIIDRLPPRMKIRTGGALELPHTLVLIDDTQRTVIEPLAASMSDPGKLQKLYDFDLMLDSGHLAGYLVKDPELESQIFEALRNLADPETFQAKYGLDGDHSVLLYAVGDGNHSLATAKAVWEQLKPEVGMDHPERFALVELVNVHDDAMQFEPIHRVLFGMRDDLLGSLRRYYGDSFKYIPTIGCQQMTDLVEQGSCTRQRIGVTYEHRYGVIELRQPTSNLAVGTLQPFLDQIIADRRAEKIDYVHGDCVLCELTTRVGNVGFYLPKMAKNDLFKTVILDGALPLKTFSMGEAHEKRFYMESRRIV